jgi:hypothetical protein
MQHLLRLSLSLTALVAILGLSASAASAEEHAFVGNKNCKKCHIKEWKSWAETKMAQTFETLKPGERAEAKTAAGLDPEKDYTTDPECVRCHVTGAGKEGGFISAEETPDHLGVGCEMCHGAGGTYTQDGYMTLKNKEYKRSEIVAAGLVEKVGIEQCQQCHNADSPFVGDDYVFDFETRKDEGTHEKFELKYNHD